MPWTKFRPIAYVNALPATPVDGTEVYYQSTIANTGGGNGVSMKDAGITWHLRYNASGNRNYPWEFVGGGPIMCSYGTNYGQALMSATPTTAGKYNSFQYATPVVIPLKGEYVKDEGFELGSTNYNGGQLRYFSWVKADTEAVVSPVTDYSTGAPWNFFGSYIIQQTVSAAHRLTVNVSTPTVLEAKTSSFGAFTGITGGISVYNISLELLPIRVGRMD